MLQFSRWWANKPQSKSTRCFSPRTKRQLQWKLSQPLYDVKSLSRHPTHDRTPRNPGQLVTPPAKWFTRKLWLTNSCFELQKLNCDLYITYNQGYISLFLSPQTLTMFWFIPLFCGLMFWLRFVKIFMYFAVIQTQDVMSYKLNWNGFIWLSRFVRLIF